MPQHSPEDIVRMVDNLELRRGDLQDRMDKDFDRYNLEPYRGETDNDGKPILDGFKKFTSNDPATTMNLALHLGSSAHKIVRVHQPRAQRQQREIDNQKEMYCLGILQAADERRKALMMPLLQDALFGQALLRGRVAQRAVLVREEVEEGEEDSRSRDMGMNGLVPERPRNRTYVDITDWDPRNTYWGMGKHGLAWACNKSWKSRDEIREEFDVDPAQDETAGRVTGEPSPFDRLRTGMDGDQERQYAVYDFLDERDNTVVMENNVVLKPRTLHGMRRVPAVIKLVGQIPVFQADQEDYFEHYGESFYKADRGIFDEQNFMYSVMSELSKRSIQQPLKLKSRDGSLSLEEDPRVSGSEVSLSTENEEEIEQLPPMEMVREAGAFLGQISAMMQRGAFPSSAFGELQFQLSGFAITQLRQGLEAPLTPFITTVQDAYKEILDILADAYAAGRFDTMELSGRLQDPHRTYFSEEILPENVRNGGNIEVELTAQLPQDDATKMNLAQIAREGPVPMLDDRFIREHILSIQDVEQVERAVWEQVAQRSSPASAAFQSMVAAEEQGDKQLAQIWQQEFQAAMISKWLEVMQLMMMRQGVGGQGGQGSNGGGQGSPAQPTGPRPETSPPEAQGIFSAPNRQAGPLAPPGSPRPGARTGATNIGVNPDIL